MNARIRSLALLLAGITLVMSTAEELSHDASADVGGSECVICQLAHQPAATAAVSETSQPEPSFRPAPVAVPAPSSVVRGLLAVAPSRAPPSA